MSRDLTTFRNHCRTMAESEHHPDCAEAYRRAMGQWATFGGEEPDRCPGCVPDEHRVEWRRLADEADAHLRRAALLADEPVHAEPTEDDVPLLT